MSKTFKQWLIENVNREELQKLLDSLKYLHFEKQKSGNYSRKTSYGVIDILGDHANQEKFNLFSPYANSEFWRIVVTMPFQNLDEISQKAVNLILFYRERKNFGEVKKIKDQFFPRWEINPNLKYFNGPDIMLKNDKMIFVYFTTGGYSASQIFNLLDNLIDTQPKFVGNIDDNDDDDRNDTEQPSPPKPSGSLINV